ncbi:hypothetical protein D9758_002012 [Tetrapyrgos nigripes]|uniref:Haloacid dehalogenase-like hydrolase domain-containing protein 3 n=1 Tax=Tetrapyrgos nigripes TaxID=182062 RepID=A0A8H5GT55_9AGAR|nr:hypothetical protein D9758_002012 [Tetrapyrgos nigripes]
MVTIRLVTFDVLHTLITPRHPVHVQYSLAFAPYLGRLDPQDIKNSFKKGWRTISESSHIINSVAALKALQQERPAYAYENGAASERWWSEVIRRTAVGAGANPSAIDGSLDKIVPTLMRSFSSREGYAAFEDALPTIRQLHEKKVFTAVVSNSDSRSRLVLKDLEFPENVTPIVLSEEEGVEKPSRELFHRALKRVNEIHGLDIQEDECLHVGDELECDYEGAVKAGMQGLLLRRPGAEEDEVELKNVRTIQSLKQVVEYV